MKAWIHGLAAAVIGAIGSAIPLVIVDPTTFNFSFAGWLNLAKVVLVTAVIAAGAYLKQSPLPQE